MKICPECGAENLDKFKFCTQCAHDLKEIESEDEIKRRLKNEHKEREKSRKRIDRSYKQRMKEESKERKRREKIQKKEEKEYRKRMEKERKEREKYHKKLEKERRRRELKPKLKKGFIVFLIIVIIFLSVAIYFQITNDNNSVIPNLGGNSEDTVDEYVTSQEEEVKMKKVDFNRLFNMYVPQDYDYSEYPPQYNSTYQWRDSNSYAPANIYYYDQSHDLNEIVSRLNEAYPGLQMVQEGNLIILSSDSGTNFVGVQSPNHEFVFIRGYDLDTSKTCANSIVFE